MLRRGHVTLAQEAHGSRRGSRWPSTPGATQPPPANPRSPLDAGHGQMSSIRACICPNLSTKPCERLPSKSAAKSMTSSCKGSILRFGSAVIHRLTISGRAERDEDSPKNSSRRQVLTRSDSMTAHGERASPRSIPAGRLLRHRGPLRGLLPATWRRSEGDFATFHHVSDWFLASFLAPKCSIFAAPQGPEGGVSRRQTKVSNAAKKAPTLAA